MMKNLRLFSYNFGRHVIILILIEIKTKKDKKEKLTQTVLFCCKNLPLSSRK